MFERPIPRTHPAEDHASSATSALVDALQADGTPDREQLTAILGDHLGLLHALADTRQDAEWHAEGDVSVHTDMALAALYAGLEHRPHAARRRAALVLGTALHDIGKPLTTHEREKGGRLRIVSPGHADSGRSYLALRVIEAGLPFWLRHAVLGLVGRHHDPRQLLETGAGRGRFAKLARRADAELLYDLEMADNRGRVALDRDDLTATVERYRLIARQHGVFGLDPYAELRRGIAEALGDYPVAVRDLTFARAVKDYEHEKITTAAQALARTTGLRAHAFPQLVLTVGPSGCGKTTWVQEHLPNYAVISLDALREELLGDVTDQSANERVVQVGLERLRAHLRDGDRVVWDATSLRRDFRRRVVGLGHDFGAWVTFVVFHVPPSELTRRNAQRSRSVPAEVLAQQLQTYHWPEATEAHRVVHVDVHGGVLGVEGTCSEALAW